MEGRCGQEGRTRTDIDGANGYVGADGSGKYGYVGTDTIAGIVMQGQT